MPFLPQNNLLSEEEKKKQQEQGNNLISGEGGNTFSLGLPTTAPTKPGGPKQSGSFTNLNSYLDANKEQSNQLGTDVSNKITGLGTEARNQFGVSKNQFGQKVNEGSIRNIDSAVSDASNTVDKAYTLGAGSIINEDEVNRFKEVTNAQYKGPNKIEDESDIYNPANELNEKVNLYSRLSETDDGRGQLLSEIYKRPTYSQGQVTFDNLLLGGNQESKQKLSDARNQVADVKDLFSALVQDSNFLAGSVKTKHDDVRNESQKYTNDKQTQRNQEVEVRLDDVESHWNDEYDALLSTLNDSDGGKNLSLTPEQMARLNVTEQQQIFNMLNGIDGATYLTQNTFDAGKVITKDEQAQLSALDMLADQYYGNQLNPYTNPDIAGTMTIADAVDGSKFGEEAKIRQELFDLYAEGATASGSGSKSESIMETDWIGNRSRTGTAYADSDAIQTLANYLAGVGPTMNTTHYVDTGVGQRNQEIDRSRTVAEAQAKEQVFRQIIAMLDAQGFDNQIKKKG